MLAFLGHVADCLIKYEKNYKNIEKNIDWGCEKPDNIRYFRRACLVTSKLADAGDSL